MCVRRKMTHLCTDEEPAKLMPKGPLGAASPVSLLGKYSRSSMGERGSLWEGGVAQWGAITVKRDEPTGSSVGRRREQVPGSKWIAACGQREGDCGGPTGKYNPDCPIHIVSAGTEVLLHSTTFWEERCRIENKNPAPEFKRSLSTELRLNSNHVRGEWGLVDA